MRGSDEMSTIFVLVNRVFGVQQALSRPNVNVNIDPILGRAVVELTDAIGQKPLVNKIESFLRWGDEIVHFLDCEMLAISRVVGVGD